ASCEKESSLAPEKTPPRRSQSSASNERRSKRSRLRKWSALRLSTHARTTPQVDRSQSTLVQISHAKHHVRTNGESLLAGDESFARLPFSSCGARGSNLVQRRDSPAARAC